MNTTRCTFNVIIIGAGPAGVAAAGSLAEAGVSVALLEAGVYAGAENWSGCVYFTENLAAPDCFGPAAVEAAPFERRVHCRGTLLHNGLDAVGVELTDPAIFNNCYTVLRPVYDPYFAHLAQSKGAVHITGTTVTSLIRRNNRVIGVQTSRGSLYSDVVFLAEGDASHLVRSERLERVAAPHYLQGVKAVLSLPAEEIEKRFTLKPGEGAAYEILLRNAAIGNRTVALNVGGFLYTNRDSLSLGYVVPLDNLRRNYRGSHDSLFEWMRGLPLIREFTGNAVLSAYGAKIIRSGGWKERPILVEDGLAVGGASTGLGVDLPFPNFTGPASASGLYFARAVKNMLQQGTTLNAKNLTKEYLQPLQNSVYGRNAQYLSAWPGYFGRANVLFGRSVDLACGSAHFLSIEGMVETGRFLRTHLLSLRGIRELLMDNVRMISSLRLWKPLAATFISPITLWRWIMNLIRRPGAADPKLGIILHLDNKRIDPASLPWPVGPLIQRLSPGLVAALGQVYANDGHPVQAKLEKAVQLVLRSMRLIDLIVLPFFLCILVVLSLGTALWDAFRFYVLKTPVDKLLAKPVMAYLAAQKKARDLDAVKPLTTLDAKLATNSYRPGTASHIRTLWPGSASQHSDMAQAGLWWVCPARVYGYEAPLFGRGKVAVLFENCIKCESCWRAEPGRVLWGRHTDHSLIYRPASAAIPTLLRALSNAPRSSRREPHAVTLPDEQLWYGNNSIVSSCRAVLAASAAFRDAMASCPASADAGRIAWPHALAKRLGEKLGQLAIALANDGRQGPADRIRSELAAIDLRLADNGLFPVLYRSTGIEQLITTWVPRAALPALDNNATRSEISSDETSALFPDRIVKQWEEEPIPDAWRGTIRSFVSDNQHAGSSCVRALSFVSPSLGLIAAHQLSAVRVLARSGITLSPGICAIDGDQLTIQEGIDSVRITGVLTLVPIAASHALLVISRGRGYLVPLAEQGLAITAVPTIGFRAAGLSDIAFDCVVKKLPIVIPGNVDVPDARFSLAMALGAADYLCKRSREHAVGRVQFPGQMLDTEGRDGIAKLGAVKALLSRLEAWRVLLETLHTCASDSGPEFNDLCAAVAAMAFSPEPGSLGYDAGQVFGGFAYSEDDLLSRSYRDSSLFRFLSPGHGASVRLQRALDNRALDGVLPELGTITHLTHTTPLAEIAKQTLDLAAMCSALPVEADPGLAGEAQALALGIRGLVARIENDLATGTSMETEVAAAEVLLSLAHRAVANATLSAGRGRVSPAALFPIEPSGAAVALDLEYDAFCSMPAAPHRSGAFLSAAIDRSVRFIPEMQLHDPGLRKRWAGLVDWFKQNCSARTFEGLHIERYIEKTHHLPKDVVRAIKENKWLATTVPQTEDGLGWHKAEYYILNSAAGSFGDAGINLLIMASTSIGTTPILLGLNDELPRVREELAPLIQNESLFNEVRKRLTGIIRTFSSPDPARIKKEYEALMKLVDSRIRSTRVVKYLAANFLRAFYGAGIAGRRGDFSGFIENLTLAGNLFEKLMPDVRAALDELPRRERCHKLFLRYLGHQGVSAFALTEPTAGSDSGGVKTSARLTSARLLPLPDGRYSFLRDEQDISSTRYMIDADRILFTDQGMAYQLPDGNAALIMHDRYDYEQDTGERYYRFQEKDCVFHDIGQVRPADSGPVYEYYSLTGAKMWITNGSIATQFCLYAQTAEGVTGFMVDRHAEGLKVGADERKTGQRGSPTNEISIDSVRVPREAVIGYEGHGQVNALETLNVGRCGLAVVSGALIRKLLHEALANIPATAERDALLGEAAAIQFGSESLAYYLVGLFDRPHESVRMESAIAKFICSEDIHEIITLVEQAYGPVGQTERYLLEKARRDSRILTIYEGTNEVQRFLILKDLMALTTRWQELVPDQADGFARILAEWKNRLRLHVREASTLLGDSSWSDAMLQPALFPLAEIAGEILRLECLYARTEWLEKRTGLLGTAYAVPLLEAGRRAAERTRARLDSLDRAFSRSWELVKKDQDLPEVRTADAALDRMLRAAQPEHQPQAVLQTAVRILVLLRPVADLSPMPCLANGSIEEIVWKADPHDRTGLGWALELKSGAPSLVSLDVLMTGPSRHEDILRDCAAPADRLVRLDVEHASPALIADAIRTLELLQQYDLIIIGSTCLNGDAGVGSYLAARLSRTSYHHDRIRVRQDGLGLERIVSPAIISVTASAAAVPTNIEQAAAADRKPVLVMKPAEGATVTGLSFEKPVSVEIRSAIMSSIAEAAAYLKTFAAAASASRADAYTEEIGRAGRLDGTTIFALLDPREQQENTAILRACRQLGGMLDRPVCAIVPTPRSMWPQLVGLAKANGADQAFCLNTQNSMLSIEGKQELLRYLLKTAGTPLVAGGQHWTEAFGYTAGEVSLSGKDIRFFGGAAHFAMRDRDKQILCSCPAYDHRLNRTALLPLGAAFLTVDANAGFPPASGRNGFLAATLDLTPDTRWLMALPPESAPSLAHADVIIDIGYGIRDHAGFALAQELKTALEALGLAPLFGATRKVTQDLKLLPLDAQIGQTGVRVEPRLIIALGISGAPQHLDYLGTRAEVLCLNKDPDAPFMKLNRTRSAPRVHPIAGDLFLTMRELIKALR